MKEFLSVAGVRTLSVTPYTSEVQIDISDSSNSIPIVLDRAEALKVGRYLLRSFGELPDPAKNTVPGTRWIGEDEKCYLILDSDYCIKIDAAGSFIGPVVPRDEIEFVRQVL